MMKNSVLLLIFSISLSAPLLSQTNYLLVARTFALLDMHDGVQLRVAGFGEDMTDQTICPGPVLYMTEGDSVELQLFNMSSGAPHTVHLHGLDLIQEYDGVPQLSFSVSHMNTGFYNFKVPHAGTYLYHCHVTSTLHVQFGMYGVVVVRPPGGGMETWQGGYPFDQEKIWLSADMDSLWHHDTLFTHPYDTSNLQVPFEDYDPDYFLINSLSEQQLSDSTIALNAAVNEVVYCRLANIGYLGNTYIFPPELNAKIVSSDGRPLPAVEISDTLEVLPGERYGVLVESSQLLIDSIQVGYFNLNSGANLSSQYIPVTIDGYFSINEQNTGQFTVYPNPAHDVLTISLMEKPTQPTELHISDASGKILKREQITTQNILIDISDLSSGVYFVTYSDYDRQISKKVVIE